MHRNLGLALTYIFDDEGGYAERDSEPGGAVNMGVSFLVFSHWRLIHGKPQPTFADLKAMSIDEATAIYEAQYLDAVHFDDLPSGLDYVMANTAVMQGVTGSVRLLQEALHLNDVDGHFGVVTLSLAISSDPVATGEAVVAGELVEKKASPNWIKDADGWTARLKRVNARLEDMAKAV